MDSTKHTARTAIEDAYVSGVLAYRNFKAGNRGELPGYSNHMQALASYFCRYHGCGYVQARDSISAAAQEGWRAEW